MAGRKMFGKLQHHVDLPAKLLLPPEPPAAVPSLYPPVVASMTAKSKASRLRRIAGHFKRVHDQTEIATKLQLITGLRRLKYVVYPQTWALNADRWYQHFTKTAYLSGLPGRRSAAGPGEQELPLPGRSAAGLAEQELPERSDAGPADQEKPGKSAAGPAEPELPAERSAAGPEEEELASMKSLLCEALLQEFYYTDRRRPTLYKSHEVAAAPFLTRAVSVLAAQCARYNPALSRCGLDISPQVNMYWFRGETRVPRGHRKGCIDPIRFQVDDTPLVQIRLPKPLKEFVPLDFVVSEEIPVVLHEPSRLPLYKKQYENKIFIGSKLDDPCKFGHTQFHIVPDKFSRQRLQKQNLTDQIEVFLRANAIASLFAWTGAQAMYQGFWSQADVTRPFVSQAVISDGKYFSFFCYQLNTLALSVDADKDPNRKNICWGTQSAPLYDVVEEDDIKGFNDDVFRQLVDFFLNSPE
ncbi:large ribosomal subunit protein mL65 [Eleutherodactylus coqui]|uniref:Mitochondrial ribosomal protein S30 n=1 Tax=Eleutherodactylus coqui TaxID=57060 RepID=A0A8J6KGK0_ELECQ|nr:hypothetical protein GDO78_007830 [Eleutherodactylus coqui]